MGFSRRNAAFALAALLGIFAALARYSSPGASPTPAAVFAAAPPTAASPPSRIKPKRTAPRTLAAKPVEPAKVRGAGLRDVGEAFGGRAPDRTDRSTPAAR